MSKKPFVTKEQVEEIVKTYPTPFHLYDEKGIRENAKALKEAFAWNPGYKEYFAVKATPNPFLLQILKEYGCGCDCSSYTELLMSDAVGIDGHDIMFSSNDTPEEDFKLADKLGAIINLDDITHIDFLEKTIGHIPETISCRYNPGGIFKISNDIMDNPGDSKYGMTTEQITEAFKTLKAKGAKEFGIHAFLASNTVTNDYYPMLAKVLFEQAVRLQKETGVHIKFINLSGGIGIPFPPQRLILSDKKIFLSESAFLCYHIRSHFSTIFYDFICFLFAKFLSNLKTIKCCKIVFRCLCTANHLYTSIFFQKQFC